MGNKKSQQLEDMEPFDNPILESKEGQEEGDASWGDEGPPPAVDGAEGAQGFQDVEADPQKILQMIGQEPITEEMLQRLQAQFGPIEIEIVEDSSEESGNTEENKQDDTGIEEDPIEVDDIESGSFNVWPQQPIRYDSKASSSGHIPLLMELEQAEEVERLSQEVARSRSQGPLDDNSDDDDNFKILDPNFAEKLPQRVIKELDGDVEMIEEQEVAIQQSSLDTPSEKITKHKSPSGALRPPWLSPVPFPPCDGMADKSNDNGMLMHSTPRAPNDRDMDDKQETYHKYDEADDFADQPVELQCEEMEVDIDSLSKDEIQELLMSAQLEGIPFDPRLIDLAASHGLEFEIVMEDEDGNVIDGFPAGENVTSSNFAELVQELKTASGHDMEMSIQYDSGVGTGTGLTTVDLNGKPSKVNITEIHQELRQHLQAEQGAVGGQYDNLPNAPTTSLEDLHNIGEETDCKCPETPRDTRKKSGKQHNQKQTTTQHFHNSDQKLGEKKKYSSGQYFELLGDGAKNTSNLIAEHTPVDSDYNDAKHDTTKSSDGDSDNDERQKYGSNRSDKSFSSNTSVDGVIDTRADLDESEEEIVITMEVPGIPTDDGGFIIDMSKMFIPISIPGQDGDKEITVEIDPSNFDFSSMVQNADGTIEVDIEREVHNWMAQSANKFAHYTTAGAPSGTDNIIYSTPSTSGGLKTTGAPYDHCDAEVNSAIRATITEQFPNKSSSESESHTGLTIRPLSETPPQTPPQHDSSGRVSGDSSSSLFDVSPAEDEVLQLLEQIGKHGQEMKKELQETQKREICLFQEKSQDEVRLAATVELLEKEIKAVRSDNKKLHKEINAGKTICKRDQSMIQRLEAAMEDLQNRLQAIQKENTNLKKTNATLERRSKMAIHKSTNTEYVVPISQSSQTGLSMFKMRTRGIQTFTVNKADFAVQQDGHHFMRNAITSTNDPIFKSLRARTHGTQTDVKIQVDRGVVAISTQERLWIGSVAHASTQVRAVSKQHESMISRKQTRDACTATVATETEKPSQIPRLSVTGLSESQRSDAKYPWHQSKQEQQQRATPVKANQPHRNVMQPQQPKTSTPKNSQNSQSVDRLFNQIQLNESPAMENSATESMDTDEEPEGPDKWQRLSSTQLTSDPMVIKLQRSLASATMENDQLQMKMKKSKEEMSTRLTEWVDLLAASKLELNQAKYDAVGLASRSRKAGSLDSLQQKITILERTLLSAQQENQSVHPRTETVKPVHKAKPLDGVRGKVTELENENLVLKASLEKIKQERDQLVKDITQVRQHHRHSIEAVTQLESSLVGVTSERQNLQKEVQVLREEYQHLKKGMEIMERYFSFDPTVSLDDLDARSSSSSQTTSVVDDVVRESEAVISALQESDKVTQQSEAVLNALKDHDQDEVVVIPSGGVEGSLHKHISALALRIQSELGIKVQLVGEVDPAEILGASIHSQEGVTTSTPTPSQEDLTSTNAVEHLFQTVGTEKPKLGVTDLQEVEDIISRAIPSPRETSPSSPRTSANEKGDIHNMGSAELRRKRLGLFVDSYTQPRTNSPETRTTSPRGRSTSPGTSSSRKTSPRSRQEMTVEDLEVASHNEPSTDHHMKTHRESRHQIKSQQPPWASQNRSNSPPKTQENGQKQPEVIRKKLTSATPLLPSKFSMTSVGVPKTANGTVNGEEPAQQPSNSWTQPKWRPFSRLAKTARLKQEPRPPSRGPSRAEMEAEATSIQDDILSRYAGDIPVESQKAPPQPEPEREHVVIAQSNPVPVKRTSRSYSISRHTVAHSEEPKSHKIERTNPSKHVEDVRPTPPKRHPQPVQHIPTERPVSRSSNYTPSIQKPVFKDYDYTDYLLAKYGGDDESTDAPQSDHHSDFPSSSQENGEVSSSDSEVPRRPSRHHSRPWSSKPSSEHSPVFRSSSKSLTPKSPRSSTSKRESRHSHIKHKDVDSHSRSVTSEDNIRPSLVSETSSYNSNSNRTSSRHDSYLGSRSDLSAGVHVDNSRTSTRPQSSPAYRTDTVSRSSHHTETIPSRPWHTTTTSYTSYPNPEITPKADTKSYYSDYLDNKKDSQVDERYWTEPKPYDYRHSISTAWKEPKKLDSRRDSDRLWPDSNSTSSGHPTPAYSRPTPSRSIYDSYSTPEKPTTAPYQSMADRYRFSTRTEPERDLSPSVGYYARPSGTTSSTSLYSHSYERPTSAVSASPRSYVSRVEEVNHDSSPYTNRDYHAALDSNDVQRHQKSDDSFINGILDKYASPTESSLYTSGLSGTQYGSVGGGSYLTDRYISSYTPSLSNYPDRYGSTSTKLASDVGSRYGSYGTEPFSKHGDPYSRVSESRDTYSSTYNHYSTTSQMPTSPGHRGQRDRRQEIEDLLNKYAPIH